MLPVQQASCGLSSMKRHVICGGVAMEVSKRDSEEKIKFKLKLDFIMILWRLHTIGFLVGNNSILFQEEIT